MGKVSRETFYNWINGKKGKQSVDYAWKFWKFFEKIRIIDKKVQLLYVDYLDI